MPNDPEAPAGTGETSSVSDGGSGKDSGKAEDDSNPITDARAYFKGACTLQIAGVETRTGVCSSSGGWSASSLSGVGVGLMTALALVAHVVTGYE